jgi:hypothetical protein
MNDFCSNFGAAIFFGYCHLDCLRDKLVLGKPFFPDSLALLGHLYDKHLIGRNCQSNYESQLHFLVDLGAKIMQELSVVNLILVNANCGGNQVVDEFVICNEEGSFLVNVADYFSILVKQVVEFLSPKVTPHF